MLAIRVYEHIFVWMQSFSRFVLSSLVEVKVRAVDRLRHYSRWMLVVRMMDSIVRKGFAWRTALFEGLTTLYD